MTRTGGVLFWLRWSLRDFRQRWALVLAISLLIAVGTGLATGLGSMESWRVGSADASYALLHGHDLRVSLADGSFVPRGTLERAVRNSAAASGVERAQERLVVPTQVDASTGTRVVLTPGRVIGVPVGDPADGVDEVAVVRGRRFEAGENAVVVEASYADRRELPASGELRVGGGRVVQMVGHGHSPDTFLVLPSGGLWVGRPNLAVLWAPLPLAQELAGVGNAVNELVLTTAPGSDGAAVEKDVRTALTGVLGGVGVTLTRGSNEDVHRILYEDASNDQQFMTVFAVLVLLGAALAAFNLITRIVETQRRQIGIGMALGVPAGKLAVRPLLLAAEVALLGVLLGVPVGLVVNRSLRRVLAEWLPLPVLETPFEPGVFARGAVIGFLVPFVAALYPVIRGVRTTPVDAIEVGARTARTSRLVTLVGRLPLPGRSLGRMPVRNAMRTPRRTLLTALALAAVIGVLVALLGVFDSFDRAVAIGEREVVQQAPERVTVQLSTFVRVESALVRSIDAQEAVGQVEPAVLVAGSARSDEGAIEIVLELLDPTSAIWRPTILGRGSPGAGTPGVVLARKAARDLGVRVGDTITIRHPRRVSARSFAYADSRVRVIGLHPNPFRTLAFMELGQAELLGLAGATNALTVVPAEGRSTDDVVRELFPLGGIASVQTASETIDSLREVMTEFASALRVAEVAVLMLVLLLAFNATGIVIEERVREHATMLAFGLPVRSVVGITALENALIGVLGTAGGLALGWFVIRWMTGSLLPEVMPEIEVEPIVSAGTLAATVVVGVGAMALAPLLSLRRLQRLDLPPALRVVE